MIQYDLRGYHELEYSSKDINVHNILNLGLLPKQENIYKGNRKLLSIDNPWLKTQVKKI